MDTDGRVRTVNCVYLNVLPAYCGKGIGKTLVDKSEVIAREKNAAYMQVKLNRLYNWNNYFELIKGPPCFNITCINAYFRWIQLQNFRTAYLIGVDFLSFEKYHWQDI